MSQAERSLQDQAKQHEQAQTAKDQKHLANEKDTNGKWTAQVKALMDEKEKMQSELHKKIQALQDELEALRSSLEAKINSLDLKVKEYYQLTLQLQADIDAKNQEIARLQDIEAMYEEAQLELKTLRAQKEELTQNLLQASAYIQDLETKLYQQQR